MNLLRINKLIISVLVSVPMFMGCSESINEGTYIPSLTKQYFSVTPRNFEFSYNEETKNGTIKSENGWSFSETPSWLTVSPASGNSDSEFSLTSQANGSAVNREAIFYVTSNIASSKIQRIITASQDAGNPYISLPEYSTSTVSVDGKGENLNIVVESNIQDLTASFSQPWGTASYNTETKRISLVIQGNESNVSREGILIVSSQQFNKTAKLTISQLASGVSILEGMSLDYGADGGTQNRTISSDLPWTAQTSSSWIEFSPASGDAGETTISITTLPSYDSDNRIGQIYFYFGDVEKKYIDVTQSGRFITPNVSTCNFPAEEGSTAEVIVDANIDWVVSSYPDWISISPSNGGEGKTTLVITVSQNNSLNPRNGNIVLQDSNSGSIESTISVIQEGFVNEDEMGLEFNWKSSTLPLYIPATDQWNASVSDDWISLSKYSGDSDETIEVMVKRNDSEDQRTSKIVISWGVKTIEIPVVQQGQYLTLNSTIEETNWNASTLELFVSSSMNTEYRIEYETEEKDWINVKTNDNDGKYIISILTNNSIYSRKATLFIMPIDDDVNETIAQGIKLPITQTGRTLTINTSEIYMSSSGGISSEYLIEADGNYSITKPSIQYDWFSITHNQLTNTFQITCAENPNTTNIKGTITILLENLPEGETLEKAITIIQLGRQSPLEFNSNSSTLPLIIPVSKWNATVSEDWIGLSKYSGNTEETIEVTVTKNESVSHREGKIMVSSAGIDFEISVIQAAAQDITLKSSEGEIISTIYMNAAGGSSEYFITPVGRYKISKDIATWWCIISHDGSSNSFKITCLQNNSNINREGTIRISSEDDMLGVIPRKTFTIIQYGKE